MAGNRSRIGEFFNTICVYILLILFDIFFNNRQYHSQVVQTAKAFIKLGLEPHNCVGVLAFNSPKWFYSNLGAIYAGYILEYNS